MDTLYIQMPLCKQDPLKSSNNNNRRHSAVVGSGKCFKCLFITGIISELGQFMGEGLCLQIVMGEQGEHLVIFNLLFQSLSVIELVNCSFTNGYFLNLLLLTQFWNIYNFKAFFEDFVLGPQSCEC